MPQFTITSLQNSRVKEAARLRDRNEREEQGRILVEGIREISRALESGVEITEVFVCESQCSEESAAKLLSQLQQHQEISLLTVNEQVMSKLTFGNRAEGLIAIARPAKRTLEEFTKVVGRNSLPLIAVVEGAEKPGNLGAILRTADAAGVSGLILASGVTDLFNPNTIRASLGAVFTVPVCAATSAEALAWLRNQKLQIIATKVDALNSYNEVNYSTPCAIILGSESRGVSPLWGGGGITSVSLPMFGAVDSLNLSATAAVLFYEALRQRKPAMQKSGSRG